MSKNYKIGFMCKVDYDLELENSPDGNEVYPTVLSLKRNRKCVNECGYVKVKIYLDKVIKKANMKIEEGKK